MSDTQETFEPLATEAGQDRIAQAIANFGSLSNALRAETAANTATQKAAEARAWASSDEVVEEGDELSNIPDLYSAKHYAEQAEDIEALARNWATKMDTYVAQETITIPAEQEGEEDTTETVNLYSAKYYAALAEDYLNQWVLDSSPTQNSTNGITSGGVYTALATKQDILTFDNSPTQNSVNPVKSGGVYTALAGKQDTLTIDSTPTQNSTNPVQSGGVYTAIANATPNITADTEPTEDSTNLITSGAVWDALQNFTPSGGEGGGSYTLPIASFNTLGGIKVGNNLSIDENGVLSASGGGGGSGDGVFVLNTHSIDKTFTCQNTEYLTDTTQTKEFIFKIHTNYERSVYKDGSDLAICAIANINGQAYGIFLSLTQDGVKALHTNNGGGYIYGRTYSQGEIWDETNEVTWYYSGNNQVGQPVSGITNNPAPTKPIMSGTYNNVLQAAKQLFQDASPQLIEQPLNEELFNPTNFTISGGDTISDNTLKSLIQSFRPIKINGETYYPFKKNGGTYYYWNPSGTVTIDSSWEITITSVS